MRKNLWFASLLGVIIFLLSNQAWAEDPKPQQGIKIDYFVGAALETHYIRLNIPNELQTVPAHHDDSATGSTTTNLHESYGVALKLHIRAYFLNNEYLALYLGGSLGIIPATSQYRLGIYDTELCDYGGESYAFTQLVPFYFSGAPVVGAQIGTFLILEASFPYTGYQLRNGHDRYGKWDEVENHTWQGFGQRYYAGLFLGYFQPGIYYETYNLVFDGYKAKATLIGLSLAYYIG